MERSRVPKQRSTHPQWHQRTVLTAVQTLTCPNDGVVMYQGPKPNFSRVSCPSCKAVWPVKR